MRNCVVAGAGRSGTSLAAGLFRRAGYYYGKELWHGTNSNPEGFFEDIEINAINEDLMNKVVPWRPKGVLGILYPFLHDRTRWGQRWLEALPVGTQIQADDATIRRMCAQVENRPYLFKDPLFSYTLPVWRPYLASDTVFICMFREPRRTVNSILKLARDERYLRDLKMSSERAVSYWNAIYTYILRDPRVSNIPWVFVHYDEIVTGRAQPLLTEILGAPTDQSMVRPELKRSKLEGSIPAESQAIYDELCALAEEKYRAVTSRGA